MLLVQTPSGTVSLPPQGFFQQQPSPFASQLTPTGLPLPRPPVSLAPRIPAPADLNSAALVQPPPPATIPPSSNPNNFARKGGFGPAEDPFEGAPVSNPAAPNSFDPANPFSAFDPAPVFGAMGTLAGPPGAGALGSALGNFASYVSQPPAIQQEISLFDAFLNTISPFGAFGQSVENQARDINRDMELNVIESALGIDPGPGPAGPTFGMDDPIAEGLPEDFGFDDEGTSTSGEPDTGFGGGGIGGTADQDDTSESSDGDGDGGGDSSYICTAAWDTGISAPETWSLNRRFGVWIRRNDPLAYEGYSVFGPWIADRIRDGKLRWIGKLKPQCWAYEMAQRSGKDTSGFPLSIKIVNRIQRATTRPLVRLLGWYVSK